MQSRVMLIFPSSLSCMFFSLKGYVDAAMKDEPFHLYLAAWKLEILLKVRYYVFSLWELNSECHHFR